MDLKVLICHVILFSLLLNSTYSKKSTQQKSKSVTTLIEAKWPKTPYLLEACEYLAEESSDLMWKFIESVNTYDTELISKYSEKEWYELILKEVEKILSESQVSMLKLALSMRSYSPRIEMYSQMAVDNQINDCELAGVDIAVNIICDPLKIEPEVKRLENEEKINSALYSLDHHYKPSIANNTVVAILYAEIGTKPFQKYHQILKKLAEDNLIDYVLRHYVPSHKREGKVYLSGYGVELQIKSTEYKVQDDAQVQDEDSKTPGASDQEEADEIEGFNFNRLKTLYPDKLSNLIKYRQHLIDTNSDLAPLKAWQLQELSLQAAERIMSSPPEEVLKTFTIIAQNFPLQARSLIRIKVSEELRKEIKVNQERFITNLNLQPTDSAIFINGLFYDADSLDSSVLLETTRNELKTMQALHEVGVHKHQMGPLLALDFQSSPSSSSSSSSSFSVEYALDIRDSAVQWVNNLEFDKQYRRWSSSLLELLRPTFPGMLRSIRKNLFNLVLIVDPSDPKSRGIIRLAESFLVHQAPLRMGFVFIVNDDPEVTGRDDAAVALLEAFNYAAETSSGQQGLSLITDVFASVSDEEGEINAELVEATFISKYPKIDTDLIFGTDSQYDTGRKLAKEFIQRSGFRKFPQVLLNGIPLPFDSLNSDAFEEAVLSEIISQTPIIQRAVYKGDLTDKDDVVDYLMGQPNIMPRLNDRVLSSKSKYIDMSGKLNPKLNVDNDTYMSKKDLANEIIIKNHYLTRKEGAITYPLTLWIVGDLDTFYGRKLLSNSLEYLETTTTIRLAYISNIQQLDDFKNTHPITPLAIAALKHLDSIKAIKFLKALVNESHVISIFGDEDEFKVDGLSDEEVKDVREIAEKEETLNEIILQGEFCRNVLELTSGSRAIIANGRILGPLDKSELFSSDDFILLEKYSLSVYVDRIQVAIKKADESADDFDSAFPRGRESSDFLMRLTSILASRVQSRSRFEIPFVTDEHSVVKLEPRFKDKPTFDISVIVDPVSRGAQKIGPILSVLQEAFNCKIRIYLNAVSKHSDMPLKSFYRYVLEPEPQFTSNGDVAIGPIARFINMPQSVLLTQNMHPPENWLVEAVRSPYDLDNIRLEDVMNSVHSDFELSSLLLEGHCSETSTGTPPRGLQVTLGTRHEPVVVDTIVMANLGYFQLKANPGAWLLRLRQGRSSEIFDIISVDGSDNPVDATEQHILISSLKSNVIKLKVSKKPDKLNVDLLAEDDAPTLWNSITSTFGKKGEEGQEEEKLNIFSLASGHLYERFIKIMMLSVLKHTKTPVKFWFLKNYLSPTLKDFLPYMAKEYGFEYALVEYKWPRWLHQQTEKQRIIWGYKILFLDVLFPLDVKKIIFVDADQIVRTDLKELRDFDLGGAPYGYTPFCDSRKEMDGFRFWKQGYWKNHLQGRRYHISALYIVDLRKFRRVAAGDRLRGQYQALSQDPNSLSNLDQDLPNNMIHQVAIKSLPQEWLWCETWCDNESKKSAKTIDLCNNPLTKEAKLTAAVRIVPEWKNYDEEIKRFQEKINSEGYHQHATSNEEKDKRDKTADRHTEL